MSARTFSGLLAPPHTPFDESGELNLPIVEQQAEHLAANDVTGVFVAGSTGEGPSLTFDERRALAERWVRAGGDAELDVVIQVGTTSVQQSKALAEHAQQIGATGVACLPPFYFKPDTVDALVDYCIAVAAAAPDLPFLYYHIPRMTGVDLPMPQFFEQAVKRIDNFGGMKFTFHDLAQAMQCFSMDDDRLSILLGWDEGWLAGLAVGFRGAIGNTYNFAAPLYYRVQELFEAGEMDAARKHQRKAIEMIRIIFRYGGFVNASKAVMSMIGIDCGPPRLPIKPLDNATIENMRNELESIGFFDWAKSPQPALA